MASSSHTRVHLSTTCLLLLPLVCLSYSSMSQYAIPAYSSPLFRRSGRIVEPPKTIQYAVNNNSDDEPINSEPEAVSFPSNDTKQDEGTSNNLWKRLDYFGQSLKPRAMEKKSQVESATSRKSKVWLGAQACAYFTLFILYRGYRGFFILLPAVFRQVYAKMETLDSPFEPGESAVEDVNPKTGKVRLRTRITVSVLAAIVTLTYVVGGLANVLAQFVKSLTSTSSPTSSFEAAADETQLYEDKIQKMTSKRDLNGTLPESSSSGSTLAP